MSVDQYMGRVYDSRHYNCAHFTCDVWCDLTGKDLRPYLLGLFSDRLCSSLMSSAMREFKQSPAPVDPSIAILQFHREAPHAGVYLRGRLLHISSTRGVRFDKLSDIASQAKKVRFYTC